ncbi:MAG: HupE/UreJ family protein [Gemmatimonadales bacterium]
MSELLAFVQLGFHHITDLAALDHILFLFALAAIYRGRDWRDLLWVVSAFTVGHSITLALAATGTLRLPTALIEFLIPLTILVTGLANIPLPRRERAPLGGGYRPAFAGVFGLVHGAGFANYLQSLFTGSIVVPLLGFNIGIELGQLVVLALAGLVLAGLDRALAQLRAPTARASTYRLRVLAVSAIVVVVAAEMAASRAPW